MPQYLRPTPWDKRTFKIDTFELTAAHEEALEETDEHEGHFTLKADPLDDPEPFIKHGFYYMDSLIEPVCDKENFRLITNEDITLSQNFRKDDILQIAEKVFVHGRFHRDFNVPDRLADIRYMRWTQDLIESNNLYAWLYNGELAGYFGFEENKVLLIGVNEAFQGRGLTKVCTSMNCQRLFDTGYDQLYTSISAANVASLNLFYSLGFKLKKTRDVYHKLNGPAPGVAE